MAVSNILPSNDQNIQNEITHCGFRLSYSIHAKMLNNRERKPQIIEKQNLRRRSAKLYWVRKRRLGVSISDVIIPCT